MENTLKAKFFSQYWLQYVFTCPRFEGRRTIPELKQSRDFKNGWLELKPLSEISDEDAIEVAKICSFCNGEGYITYKDTEKICVFDKYEDNPDRNNVFRIYLDEFDIFMLDENGNVFQYDWCRLIEVTDYLRSRGYCLPWMGLSCEKLIEYGWVKLNRNEK